MKDQLVVAILAVGARLEAVVDCVGALSATMSADAGRLGLNVVVFRESMESLSTVLRASSRGLEVNLVGVDRAEHQIGSALAQVADRGGLLVDVRCRLSPFALRFVEAAIAEYGESDNIAGISLGFPLLRRAAGLRFQPVLDGTDVYFGQMEPISALALSGKHARALHEWVNGVVEDRLIDCWKVLSQYAVKSDRYFLFPRTATAYNESVKAGVQSTNLDLAPRSWRWSAFAASIARYDEFFEISPASLKRLCPALGGWDFGVDLFAEKDPACLTEDWIVSSRVCTSNAASWGLALVPLEANFAFSIEGTFFALGRRSAFDWRNRSDRRRQLHRHLSRTTSLVDYARSLIR